MPHQKTSVAENLTVRFNPSSSPAYKRALTIIKDKMKKGFSLVDILTDALLRAEGIDPVRFNEQAAKQGSMDEDRLALLIAKAVKDAIGGSKVQTKVFDDDDEADATETAAHNAFKNSFMSRVKSGKRNGN